MEVKSTAAKVILSLPFRHNPPFSNMAPWKASIWASLAILHVSASFLPDFQGDDGHVRRQACSSVHYDKQCGVNYDYTGFTQDQNERADAVVEMFRHAWTGYFDYAFPNDDLLPKNNSYRNSRNGWGLTAIDGLDTAIIMEQQDIVDVVLDFIPTVDFTKNNAKGPQDAQTTSLFETNIRYLGGLLSSYDLLKGPFKHLAPDGDKRVDALLSQAVSLADTLKFCFDTPSGIPVNLVWIDNQTFTNSSVMLNGDYTAGLAEIGTLVLEWQHLSDLSGDPSYGELAQRAESYWFQAPEVWPGLTGGTLASAQVNYSTIMVAGHRETTVRMNISSRCMSTTRRDIPTIVNAGLQPQTPRLNISSAVRIRVPI